MTLTMNAPQKKPTPTLPRWSHGFENLSREHGFVPLRVEGRLPDELRGTFYRNGPGRFDVAGERYHHWFDADGAVTAVRLDGTGAALGASKLVSTRWRDREREAGRRLYGSWGTPMVRPIRELFMGDIKNSANTSVMLHNGRIYALCEAGKPFELDPDDLSTLGETDLDGVVRKAFSAHPHRVRSRATTYGFGLGLGRKTEVDCYALPDGEGARRIGSFKLDGVRVNHDFAATERHLIFFFAPVSFSLLKILGGQGLAASASFDANRGTEIVVVPIDEPSEIVRFTVPSFYMEHVLNAYELPGGEIAIDYTHYADLRDLEDFASTVLTGSPKRSASCTLRRAIVNPRAKTFTTEILVDEGAEMPRVSPRTEGSKHRFAYCTSAVLHAPWRTLLKIDLETGRIDRYEPGREHYPSEAVFVPKKDARSEDDGWLLTLVLDGETQTSHLQVLDATRFGDAPVARCYFDQVIPLGFHGTWAPART